MNRGAGPDDTDGPRAGMLAVLADFERAVLRERFCAGIARRLGIRRMSVRSILIAG